MTRVNLTRAALHVLSRQNATARVGTDITEDVYADYLAGETFPAELLPVYISPTTMTSFNFINGLNILVTLLNPQLTKTGNN